jgi:hypothetical protein
MRGVGRISHLIADDTDPDIVSASRYGIMLREDAHWKWLSAGQEALLPAPSGHLDASRS